MLTARSQPMHIDPALAGTIELAKVDVLPGAELKLPRLYNNGDGGTHGRGLEVRMGISLCVPVGGAFGKDPVQAQQHVVNHIRVSIFVNGHPCRGMGHKDHHYSVLNTDLADCPLNKTRNIDELGLPFGRNLKFHMNTSIRFYKSKNCSGVYTGIRDNLKSEILREIM